MNTVKKHIFNLIIVSLIIFFNFTQPLEAQNYSDSWDQVEELTKKGLPRSALMIVDEVYKEAKSDNNTPQIIKSLIYRVSLQSRFEDEHVILSINDLSNKIDNATFPEKEILHSLIAELYNAYLNDNRWVINKRQVIVDDNSKDITTWDAIRLNKEIDYHYLKSLENKDELSKINLREYYLILRDGDSSNTSLFPYLYDLLANRALNYYSSSDYKMLSIGEPSVMGAVDYIVPLNEFLKKEIDPTISATNQVMTLFQKLISIHKTEGNTDALVDVDLRRLKFAFNSSNQDKKAVDAYIKTLRELALKYINQPVFVLVGYELANQYYNEAGNYSQAFSPDNKFYNVIADSICRIAITEYPQVNETNKCRNLSERINIRALGFEIPVAQLPGEPTLSLVEFQNIDKLYFKVVLGDPKANADRHNLKEYIQRELRKEGVISWSQELPVTKDLRKHTTEIIIPELPSGYYVIFASDDSLFSTTKIIKYKPLWISNLSYISKENSSEGNTELFILDRESGKSIGDVGITIYQQQYDNRDRGYTLKNIGNIQSDKYGYAKIEAMGESTFGTYMFIFEKDNDRLSSENYLNFFRSPVNSKPMVETFLFTDRAIYRPGQTVYFKGIVIEKANNSANLLVDYQVEVTFTNASRKKINTLNLITNEAGSIDGFFTIPADGLNGNMTIKTKSGTVSFLVENYKRPTYEVAFDTLTGQPRLGESVSVTGTAMGYAGNAIDGASVNFRVVRKTHFPIPYYRDYITWIPPYANKDIDISFGNTQTNSDGSFIITFEALNDNTIPEEASPIFTYLITAEITDITGEVRTAETSVRIGYKAVNLEIDIAQNLDISNFKAPLISARNLDGNDISFNANATLYKIKAPHTLLVSRQWPAPEFNIISENEFRNNFPHEPYKDDDNPLSWNREKISSMDLNIVGQYELSVDMFAELDPGDYLLFVEGKDKYGSKVESNGVFTLFSSDSKKMPEDKIDWVVVNKNTAEPGETVKLIVGSSTRKSRLLYEIVNDKKIVARGWVSLNKHQKIIDIPVLESYRGNFTINVAMVKFNRYYSKRYNITVPFTNKKLDIALETFRSYLTPGKEEEWKVTVSGSKGENFSAQLLAGMYDASLDVFNSESWNMNLYTSRWYSSQWESNQFHSAWSSALFVPETEYFRVAPTNYPVINWFGYYLMGYNPIAYDNRDFLYRKSSIAQESMGMNEEVVELIDRDDDIAETVIEEVTEEDQEIIPLRTNFNETAFFYPNLVTDSSGNISFKFTTPDALTEWKIRMLAYTSDLKVGTLEQKIKSQKEIMIIPNVPRFVRQGDTIVFTAKVINFTDKQLVAKSKIEFFNAITMKPISIIMDGISLSQSQTIDPKQSAAVAWEIFIPDGVEMLAYRIRTSSEDFSDGEERMFPVLTNRMLVTNTLPMNVSGATTTTFNFNSLADFDSTSSKRNYRYTVEFTSNPSWYAVQALPYLSNPENKSNLALYNSYFANALSSFIVNSNPNIRAVFESWKTLTPDAFLSNLQKNSELKNAVINSTPWLLDAEDETEQKYRIGVLFDVARMSQEKQNVLNKLIENQLPTGAWPWFKGMREDRHTTQSILLGMAKLHNKGVLDIMSDNKRLQMVRKAVNWIDKRIVDDYNKLLKNNPKTVNDINISSSQIQYLYLRALLIDMIPVKENSKEAVEYFTNQAKKYWLKQSNLLQGMIAITLNKSGHRNESEAIIRSLVERSLFSEDMGMYWRQESSWNWYQSPVETQAMMIETMAKLENNPTIVEQLKVWLIKQKQTQNWKTSSATAEAVFALLMYGNNTLDETGQVSITVGDKIITDNQDITKEAGTGYFSTSWSGSEITPALSQIIVANPNNNIAWGAAYWQFFEDMDKIESHDSPLTLSKNLTVEKMTKDGPVLQILNENEKLITGDKVVVRMVISVDRNMEYIHLKDMRATTFEPSEQISGYSYSGGLWYYKNITDVSTEFFIRYLQKGTYVIEYPLFVTQNGNFTNGIATIQSMYAPEFGAHSSGTRVVVGE